MKYGNLNLGQIEALVNKLGGMESVERVLRDEVIIRLTPTLNEKEYTVVVDYTMSFTDMITAGRYDCKNDDITSEHFPIAGSGKVDTKLHLVHLNREATTKEVEAYLNTIGLQPAKIEHLLALGEKYPNLQREYSIIALGTVWVNRDGDHHVPFLRRSGLGRDLSLYWDDPDDRWGDYCRFLVSGK